MTPMPESRTTATAYHEAGHAVLRVYHGLPLRSVSIVPETDDEGATDGRPDGPKYDAPIEPATTPADRRRIAIALIQSLWAGIYAERLADPD